MNQPQVIIMTKTLINNSYKAQSKKALLQKFYNRFTRTKEMEKSCQYFCTRIFQSNVRK
jgi:hypothetical protein